MSSVNRVVMIGRVCNIKQHETKTGKAFITFGLRLYEKRGQKEKVTFVDCAAYSAIAETIIKHGKPNEQVYIEGYLDVYSDDSGSKRTSVVLDDFRFLGNQAA